MLPKKFEIRIFLFRQILIRGRNNISQRHTSTMRVQIIAQLGMNIALRRLEIGEELFLGRSPFFQDTVIVQKRGFYIGKELRNGLFILHSVGEGVV